VISPNVDSIRHQLERNGWIGRGPAEQLLDALAERDKTIGRLERGRAEDAHDERAELDHLVVQVASLTDALQSVLRACRTADLFGEPATDLDRVVYIEQILTLALEP